MSKAAFRAILGILKVELNSDTIESVSIAERAKQIGILDVEVYPEEDYQERERIGPSAGANE